MKPSKTSGFLVHWKLLSKRLRPTITKMQTKLAIFFSAVVVCCPLRNGLAKPVQTLEELFMNSYSQVAANGKAMHNLLGVNATESAIQRKEYIKRVNSLSVADKSRYALLYVLAFNVEGEGVWNLGDLMGDDKIEVAKRLSKISEKDFQKACRNLQVPPERFRIFHVIVKDWLSGK